MSFKEETFSNLEKTLDSLLKSARDLFKSKDDKLKSIVNANLKVMEIHEDSSGKKRKIELYRDVMFMQEYRVGNFSLVRESGVVLNKDLELAKLEIFRLKNESKEVESAYLSEIELSDIPMLALFLESLKIDVEK